MSETAKQLFEGLNVGQQMRDGMRAVAGDIKAELSRLGTQGSMELASALFNGSGFVPYGPGQYTPSPEHDSPEVTQDDHSIEHGRER